MLLFADDSARAYLAEAGVPVLDGEGDPAAVFVAHADTVDFTRLEQAARAVLAGARLLTASYQPAYAGANGPIFSRGAMTAAAIAKATGARPVIVGKPSRAAVQAVTERLGVPFDQPGGDRRRRGDGRRPRPPRGRAHGPRSQRHQRRGRRSTACPRAAVRTGSSTGWLTCSTGCDGSHDRPGGAH